MQNIISLSKAIAEVFGEHPSLHWHQQLSARDLPHMAIGFDAPKVAFYFLDFVIDIQAAVPDELRKPLIDLATELSEVMMQVEQDPTGEIAAMLVMISNIEVAIALKESAFQKAINSAAIAALASLNMTGDPDKEYLSIEIPYSSGRADFIRRGALAGKNTNFEAVFYKRDVHGGGDLIASKYSKDLGDIVLWAAKFLSNDT